MLVLSRKIGEAVMIGARLQVEVANVDLEQRSVELLVKGAAPTGGNGHERGRISRGGVLLQLDESHQPAPGVEITLVDVREDAAGSKARLGITAPPGMAVHRREVFDAIQREQQEGDQRQQQLDSEDEQDPTQQDSEDEENPEE